jgi:hypothetical protein
MNKSPKAIKKKTFGRGPLARKVIASAQRHLQKKITSLADWREAKVRAEDFQKTIISANDLTQYDPVGGEIIFMRQWACEKVHYNAMSMNRC